MRHSTSRNAYKKSFFSAWLLGLLIMLSCNGLNPGASTKSTDTPAASPTATVQPTKTATPNVTPTLGTRSIWRISRVAFSSNRSGNFQIYLMKPDGSELTQLTDSVGDNLAPAWSRDAKQIAFESTRDGNSEIYIMNSDGTKQKNLTQSRGSKDYSPIWLPNGKIAFVSDRLGRERIFTMDANGKNLQSFKYTSIDSASKFFCLTWLSEGLISFTTEENGERQTRVLDTEKDEAWTPDIFKGEHDRSCPLVPSLVTNSWALIVSNRDGHDEIYKLNMGNEQEVQLTKDSVSSLGISRSSNEGWIVFYSKRSGDWDIYMMESSGQNQWNLTNDPADDIQPAWEPY